MGYTIAIAGKGGTGKTTIAALLVRLAKDKKLGSILAVDADPNSNLAEALGVVPEETIGNILNDITTHPDTVPKGMTKDRFIEYRVQNAVQENDGFDLITMGRPEGSGCYCYVNNVLRGVMGKLTRDYDYVVIDNEAGLEHFSRRTTRFADILLVVSDATSVGLKAAGRISDIIKELGIKTKNKALLINRWEKEIDQQKLNGMDLDYLGNVPADELISKISLNGSSLWKLEECSKSLNALIKLGDKIWQMK